MSRLCKFMCFYHYSYPRSMSNNTSDVFELQHLQFKSDAEVSYLEHVQYLYMYEIHRSITNDSTLPIPFSVNQSA